MELGEFTPELIKKRKWVFKHLVRKNMQERYKAILKYTGYTSDDLAFLLGRSLKTIDRYMRDSTKIPVDDLLLIARLCNVQVDYFPDMNFYLDLELRRGKEE